MENRQLIMIDEAILKHLKEKKGEINFDNLIKFMKDTKIVFKNNSLRNVYGMATYSNIYIDMKKICDNYNAQMIWYVILHEIGHFKRICKIGKEAVIEMLSLEDFETFFNRIMIEEMIADRYACFVYKLLVGKIFPREATQQLNIESKKEQYRYSASRLFGVVNNNEKNYEELVNSVIL